MKTFTQTTNDLSHLSKIILAGKRDRIVRKTRVTREVVKLKAISRTAIVRAIQKETGQDESTARGIMKIRGLK